MILRELPNNEIVETVGCSELLEMDQDPRAHEDQLSREQQRCGQTDEPVEVIVVGRRKSKAEGGWMKPCAVGHVMDHVVPPRDINGLGSMSAGGSMDQGPERGGKRSLGLGQVRLHHRVQNLQQREKEDKT
jgi:hypothetical protein